MSLRDEIAKAIAASNDSLLLFEIRDATDALMPIVERAIRRTVDEIAIELALNGHAETDAIVARVMEGE